MDPNFILITRFLEINSTCWTYTCVI